MGGTRSCPVAPARLLKGSVPGPTIPFALLPGSSSCSPFSMQVDPKTLEGFKKAHEKEFGEVLPAGFIVYIDAITSGKVAPVVMK